MHVGKNRVHVNAKNHFNARVWIDKQTNEQTESSMWSNDQIIETPSVDTLVTTSCLTLLPLSSPPVGNILQQL